MITRACSGVCRRTIEVASARRNDDLPLSPSPKSRKCGSAAKSRTTGCRSASAMPIGIPAPAVTSSVAYGTTAGSSRTGGAPGPVHAAATALISLALSRLPVDGRTARKCSPSSVIPRPGAVFGTFSAALRDTAESDGSPRRSSSREPNRSRIAGRKSIQRDALATTWMPYDRPRVARSVMTGSRSSYSPRIVLHPSTTRNTSARPLGEERRDLADGTADRRRLLPAGRPADVRQLPQSSQPATAEVETVDLHLRRGVGQRQSTKDGAQERGLAALRAADHGH